MTILDDLKKEARSFASERDWFQFHTPKNLAMAITGEAGELAAELQWLTPCEADPNNISAERLESIRLEMADVFIYLIRLADVLGVELAAAARDKMRINEARFPASDSKSSG